MFNPFWWYCLVWSAQLILYELKWADILMPMDDSLRVFIIITIIISGILGWVFKDRFCYLKPEKNPHKHRWITLLILIGYAVNFYCAKDVPLFSSLVLHESTYSSFDGIKTFAPLLYTFDLYYCVYLIFVFSEYPSFALGMEVFATALMPLLMMNRNFMLLIALSVALSYLGKNKKKKLIKIFGVIVFCIAALYIFGGMGNIRGGNAWHDSSWMISYMGINNRWPDWLSYQFVSAYSYITHGLNNFNYTIALKYDDPSTLKLILCFLPDFLAKRTGTIPDVMGKVIDEGMNTAVGYAGPYVHGGYFGMALMFIGIMLTVLVVSWLDKKANCAELHNPTTMSLIFFSAMSFFSNPFYYCGSIMTLCFAVLFTLLAIASKRKDSIPKERFAESIAKDH